MRELSKVFFILFLAILGLRCCGGFSLVAASRVCSLVAAYRLPIVVAVLVVEHGFQVRGFSSCHTGSVVAVPGLQSTGSIVVVHWLSCSVACGFFPDQGSNPCILHWKADSLLLSHQGNPLRFFFMSFVIQNYIVSLKEVTKTIHKLFYFKVIYYR